MFHTIYLSLIRMIYSNYHYTQIHGADTLVEIDKVKLQSNSSSGGTFTLLDLNS